MELIPIPKQLERNSRITAFKNKFKSARYLLDENCTTKDNEPSPEFLPFRVLIKIGTPDWLLLEIAKEHNLIITTRDKGLVLRAVSEEQDIVYQTEWGDRILVKGKIIQSGCEVKKQIAFSDERRRKKLLNSYYEEYYFL